MRRLTASRLNSALGLACSQRFVSHPSYFEAKTISDDQVKAFHRDGIVCIPNFMSTETADQLRNALSNYVEEEVAAQASGERQSVVFSAAGGDQLAEEYFLTSGDKIRFFLEKGQDKVSLNSLNKVAHALHTDNGVFQHFCQHPSLGGIARRLGRSQPSIVQSMYILKPPHVGTAVPPHQDSTWIHTTPFSCLGMWFALDDCTVHNSCLHAVLGSHQTHVPLSAQSRLVKDPETGRMKSDLQGDLPDVSKETLTPLECPKGSLVLFGGETIHSSTDNNSDKRRHAFVFHVVDDSCVWTKDNWFGDHLARLKM